MGLKDKEIHLQKKHLFLLDLLGSVIVTAFFGPTAYKKAIVDGYSEFLSVIYAVIPLVLFSISNIIVYIESRNSTDKGYTKNDIIGHVLLLEAMISLYLIGAASTILKQPSYSNSFSMWGGIAMAIIGAAGVYAFFYLCFSRIAKQEEEKKEKQI